MLFISFLDIIVCLKLTRHVRIVYWNSLEENKGNASISNLSSDIFENTINLFINESYNSNEDNGFFRFESESFESAISHVLSEYI